jgi:hypothetical protein
MPEYVLSNSAAVIDSAITRVASADTTPTNTSQNMVTSGGVKSYIDDELGDFIGKTVTTESTGIDSTDNDASIPTCAAVNDAISSSGFKVASYGRLAAFNGNYSQVIPITELYDPHNIGAVANGTVTLGAGTYLVEYSGDFQRLYNSDEGDVFYIKLRHNGSTKTNDTISVTNQYGSAQYERRSSGLIVLESTQTQTVDIYGVPQDTSIRTQNVYLTVIKIS